MILDLGKKEGEDFIEGLEEL